MDTHKAFCISLGFGGLTALIFLLYVRHQTLKSSRVKKDNDTGDDDKDHRSDPGSCSTEKRSQVQVSPIHVAEENEKRCEFDASRISKSEAEMLVSKLWSTDTDLLQHLLITVANAAAFTSSQNTLREAGALPRLTSLLRSHSMALKVGQSVAYPAVVNGVISSINNMAMNDGNQKHLKDCIPALIDFASTDKADESLQLASLQALTNLSVKPENHEPYTKLIQQLFEYLDNGSANLKIQALKVLANLSTNEEMVPHLLAAKAPRCLFEILSPDANMDLLIRWTTILANVMCNVHDRGLTAGSLPPEYKAPSPETTYTALYGLYSVHTLKSKVFVLSRHSNSDIRHQASRIYSCFS